jgi:hypothetical protein
VEAYNSISKVERYYAPLRRLYEIFKSELQGEKLNKETILQIAVKAVNNTTGLNGLVPTLLVFKAYPRITEQDPLSPIIIKRAEAIRIVIKEIQRLYAKRQVQEALAIQNGPDTS